MVCPRCIEVVRSIFHELKIPVANIRLGEADTNDKISIIQKEQLEKRLIENGFELLQDQKSKIIGQIKAILIDQIHYKGDALKVNFSTILSEKLNTEYSSLSRLFSSVEGITIERFILKQKAERVKELIFYDEITFSEIAFKMNYSSVAHLSAQFKKETGMTPSEFKKMRNPGHRSLDSL